MTFILEETMSSLLIAALTAVGATANAQAPAAPLAAGTNNAFYYEVTTTAPASAVWAIWIDVAGWGRWDKGLKSATLEGPFVPGARGRVTPLSGPRSGFVVREVREGVSYRFTTALPLASLSVTRTLTSSANGQLTTFRHNVSFSGLLGPFWANRFGPGFRAALPPTMTAIATLAEAHDQ
jgi:Polyketide cyclase / dehydrase and lipid transport